MSRASYDHGSPTVIEVDRIAKRLNSDDRFDGLLLFGSLARGEARPDSDIDLLAVHHGPVPDDVLGEVGRRTSIAFYTPQRFSELPDRSPLFANHLVREGVILHDRSGGIAAALQEVEPLRPRATERLASFTSRRIDEVLADPNFTSTDRLSAAELYGLSKQAALIDNARRGVYEFNRHRAFGLLGERHRHLAPDIRSIERLEAAWLARRRTSVAPASIDLSAALLRSINRVIEIVAD